MAPRRYQLVELMDQPWFPGLIRDAMTDYLQFVIANGKFYHPIAELLRAAIDRVGDRQVVDLCSGGGGPWLELQQELNRQGAPLAVFLTDRYPNRTAFARITQAAQGRIIGYPHPVDATAVPARLTGFRTIFTGLHHFPPELARAILADAVAQRRGIGVFEFTQRSWLSLLSMCLTPFFAMLATPLITPFRWSRLFWTYVVPVVPLAIMFDGMVSCLRTYTPDEMRALVAGLDDEGYYWEIGKQTVPGALGPITYLIGTPHSSR